MQGTLLVASICSGILSPWPGCRSFNIPLLDRASTQVACMTKAQEVIAQKLPLYPGSHPGRWGYERRKIED